MEKYTMELKHITMPSRKRLIERVLDSNKNRGAIIPGTDKFNRLAVNWLRHGPCHYDKIIEGKPEEEKQKALIEIQIHIAASYPELMPEAIRQLHDRLYRAVDEGGYFRRSEVNRKDGAMNS
jgi:hypothetical protein